MEEKPNYYAIIPAEVRYDPELKDKAKLLFGEITSLSNKNGYCYASNRYFARLYKVDVSTISRLIKNLSDKGYIKVVLEYKKGTKEISKRCMQICNGGYRQFCIGGIGNFAIDNNTSINNTSINKKENIKRKVLEDVKDIITYLNEKTNSNYKTTTKSSIQKISARLNEGFTIDDFKKVIDKKYNEWIGTKFEMYLRPDTLFGTKFESYLNQKVVKEQKKESNMERLNRHIQELEEEERRKNDKIRSK